MMKPAIIKEHIEKLIPVLSEKEKKEISVFYKVHEKYAGGFSEKMTGYLKTLPVHGKAFNNIPDEVSVANRNLLHELQKTAISDGNWLPYVEHQLERDMAYARLGVDFKSWYDLNLMAKNYITPYLEQEYAGSETLFSALNGMNRLADFTMGITAAAYLQEKEEIIRVSKEEIKKQTKEQDQREKGYNRKQKLSDELYADLFEDNPASISINRISDAQLISVNNTFLELFGFESKDEVIGKTALELNLWANPKNGIVILNFLNETKTIKEFEAEGLKRNGEKFWMYAYLKKVMVADIPCLLASVIDITERKKVEVQLEEYHYFFKNSNDLCLIANSGFFEIVNPTIQEALGYTEKELTGIPFFDFIHPDDVAGTVREVEALKKGVKTINFKNRYRKKNGDYFLIEWNAAPDPENGKIYAIGRDITQREKIINELEESNSKFLKLFYSSPVAMVISDIETGVLLDVNEQYEKLFGFPKAEVIGKTSVALGITTDASVSKNLRSTAARVKSLKNIDVSLYNAKKEKVEVNISIETIRLADKDCLFSVLLDITERKKNERALQYSEEKFRDLINFSPVGITLSTIQGEILETNPAVLEMTGYTSKAELMNIPGEALYVDPVDREQLVHLFKKDGFVKNLELQLKKKNGVHIWINSTVIPFRLPDGEAGLLSVTKDITERKKATDELKEANKELESFSYSVSHDLRAPLRAINGFARILYEDYAGKLDGDGLNALHTIQKNSKKMGELIDALLAFSRLGRKDFIATEINMIDLVWSVWEEEMTGNSDKIELTVKELLPASGDAILIKQVWTNLISNALKYSKKASKIKIEIGSYTKDNRVVFYVKDNGAGFDMQYYDKLFGVFQRLHAQEEFEGTGIGLANVQKIIHRHGGTVWANSTLNEGTVFYFSLAAVSPA